MQNLLITGASGFLGWHLCRYFSARGFRVTGTFHRHSLGATLPGVELSELDLLAPSGSAVWDRDFSAVVHTAALTRPDECERDTALTGLVNVDGTRRLVERFAGTRFVFLSTDLVFAGTGPDYNETDRPDPPNTYARSKLWGENLVRGVRNGVVARMALLYGPPAPFGGGFLGWLRSRAEQGLEIPLFTDQYRTPVYVGDVARAIEWMITGSPKSNLYHVGGAERINRWDFGRLFAEVFGLEGSRLAPVQIESAGMAVRGKDCSLDSSRLRLESGLSPCTVGEGLRRMRDEAY